MRFLAEAHAPHTKEVLVGHVAEVIADRAAQLGCVGIVLGARGLADTPVTLIK